MTTRKKIYKKKGSFKPKKPRHIFEGIVVYVAREQKDVTSKSGAKTKAEYLRLGLQFDDIPDSVVRYFRDNPKGAAFAKGELARTKKNESTGNYEPHPEGKRSIFTSNRAEWVKGEKDTVEKFDHVEIEVSINEAHGRNFYNLHNITVFEVVEGEEDSWEDEAPAETPKEETNEDSEFDLSD